jgi:hypothetical protein
MRTIGIRHNHDFERICPGIRTLRPPLPLRGISPAIFPVSKTSQVVQTCDVEGVVEDGRGGDGPGSVWAGIAGVIRRYRNQSGDLQIAIGAEGFQRLQGLPAADRKGLFDETAKLIHPGQPPSKPPNPACFLPHCRGAYRL